MAGGGRSSKYIVCTSTGSAPHPYSPWFQRSKEQIYFKDLYTIAGLAKKYKVQEIITEIVDRLTLYFPSRSLKKWDNVTYTDENMLSVGEIDPLHIVDSDAIAVVNLARLLGAHHLIPIALYVCCTMEQQEALVDGIAYGDEVVRLSQDDLRRCLLARRELLREASQVFLIVLNFISTKPTACVSWTQQCRRAIEAVARLAVEEGFGGSHPSPIDEWGWWLDATYKAKPGTRPCPHCQKSLKRLIDKRREEAWKKLGDTFDVKTWPVTVSLTDQLAFRRL